MLCIIKTPTSFLIKKSFQAFEMLERTFLLELMVSKAHIPKGKVMINVVHLPISDSTSTRAL